MLRKINMMPCALLSLLLMSVVPSGAAGPAPEGAVSKSSTKAEALFEKGHQALDHKKLTLAESCYRKAILLNSDEPKYHRQLALLLLRMGRAQEAEREILLAINLDPGDWRSLLVLGSALHIQKRMDEECEVYKRAVKVIPDSEKQLRAQLQEFIRRDELAARREVEQEKKKKDMEEAQYRDAY